MTTADGLFLFLFFKTFYVSDNLLFIAFRQIIVFENFTKVAYIVMANLFPQISFITITIFGIDVKLDIAVVTSLFRFCKSHEADLFFFLRYNKLRVSCFFTRSAFNDFVTTEFEKSVVFSRLLLRGGEPRTRSGGF